MNLQWNEALRNQPTHASWCDRARTRLLEMESLIRAGRGDARVSGGGCTDPGGGIVPTTRTAHEMAAVLRELLASDFGSCPPPMSPPPFGQPLDHIGGSYDWWWWNIGRQSGMPYHPRPHESSTGGIRRNGSPAFGFGQGEIVAPASAAASPWPMVLATSVVGAAASWIIEEIAHHTRKRYQRRL